MKFLHTADLHLGRILHERSLEDDQKAMLAGLTALLAADDYQALVIAGDVYDRSIPAPEAVSLFGSFLADLRRRFPDLAVLAVPGNHDSPERLGFGRELFGELGIHIGATVEAATEPVILGGPGPRTAFFLLPFLSPGVLRSQRDLAREAAERLEAARTAALADGADRTVLVAHLFAQGGAESDSERIFLGSAERVDPALFAGFDYVALGHLHRRQRVGTQAWYSGSPLAYSFAEADHEKGALAVDLAGSPGQAVTVTPLPLRPLRRLRRRSGGFETFLEGSTLAEDGTDFREDYLELTLTDSGLVDNPLALLRRRFPQLLAVRQGNTPAAFPGASAAPAPIGDGPPRRGAAEDFELFLQDLYGTAAPAELDLFRELSREAENAAQ